MGAQPGEPGIEGQEHLTDENHVAQDNTGVDDAALASAGQVAGLTFTEAERKLMQTGVAQNREYFSALRAVKLGNAGPPPFQFNPRLHASPRPASPIVEQPGRVDAPPRPDNLEEVAFASLRELGAMLRAGHVTSMELTQMYLARLKRYGPGLACVATLTEELALSQAAQADRELAAGVDRGPLHGIPWGAKDLLAVRDYPTGWGAPPYRRQVFDFDATVVERLAAAGAVLVAKLSMGSLAWGDVWYGGKTKTPWDRTKGASGSSAGSGAATAAGLVGFAIGTETNGSIVSPSTECGLTGLRPTFGRVSRYGAMTLAWTLDKIGPMCRSAEDCARVFAALHGPDGRDASVVDALFAWEPVLDLSNLRMGYLAREFDEAGEFRETGRAALAQLRELGVELVPLELPDYPPDAMEMVLWVEAAAAFDELTRSGQDDLLLGQDERSWPNRLRVARLTPAVEYLQAQRLRERLIGEMAARLAPLDGYVAPSYSRNLWLTNATGHPAVVLPTGQRTNGLPASITLMGHYDDEARLLALAKAYQSATDFHRRMPSGYAV